MLGNILPPYHSLQELNLDWILTKVKNILRFVPDDGAVGQILRRTAHGAEWSNEQAAGVSSVNGQTGDVTLSIPDSTSDLVNDSGFVDAAGAAAAAPVQSVNGQTGNVISWLPYFVCSTAGGTAAKKVTGGSSYGISSMSDVTAILVKFTAGNSASSPTLEIDGLGALPIYQYGTTAAGGTAATTGWQTGQVVMLVYDGSAWYFIKGYNTNTTYSVDSVLCATAAGTAGKTSTNAAYYVLRAGNIFEITFRYSNNKASALTLNVNSTGAKPIYINGTASSASNYTLPAGKYLCYYDGSNYHINTTGKAPIDITGTADGNYSASNPPPYPVTSVNGQTGAVSLSIPDSTSDLINDSGFVDAAGAAAAAPVQSVNGQTGAVVIAAGAPTVIVDDTSYVNGTIYEVTKTYTVTGDGAVLVSAAAYSDTTNDFGMWQAEIFHNNVLIFGEGTRFATSYNRRWGASASCPIQVSNGDTIKIHLYNSKTGTISVFRRFMCFGCTVS